jgi:hypothetical protein
MGRTCLRGGVVGVACALALGLALDSAALQFTPSATARLHAIDDPNGPPGAEWNTGGVGVNGQIEYFSVTDPNTPGILTVGGQLDVLNWFDPLDSNCPTNADTCSLNFAPDLQFTMEAEFDSVVTTVLSPSLVEIVVNFCTTVDGLPDMVMIDPTDPNTILLEADFTAGTFGTESTFGLQASVLYNPIANVVLAGPSIVSFSLVDPNTPYATLFQSGSQYVRLDLSFFPSSSFTPSLLSLIAAVQSGPLPSFTAEGEGQVFRVNEGEFIPIPEPSSLGLLGLGVLGLGAATRQRRRGSP